MGNHNKQCQKCQASFLIEERDLAFYDSMNVPEPTFCPECRLRRRLAWINMRKLYRRKLSGSGKEAISMYSDDKPFTVIEDKEWWSDSFDATRYGNDYDFSRPFFKQFRELMERVPLPHLHRDFARMDHSEYCNAATGVKNCYVSMAIDECENAFYCFTVEHIKDCIDVAFSLESELCYESTNLKQCYNVRYSNNCEKSSNLIFCDDCSDCTDCFGCINLRNASYHFLNQPHSKEEYERKVSDLKLTTEEGVKSAQKLVSNFTMQQPHRFMHGRNNEHVSGEYIDHSKNVFDAYTISNTDECRYVHFLRSSAIGGRNADGYDWSLFGIGSERIIDSAWCGLKCNTLRFCYWNYYASDLQYCFGCHSSDNCFGCIGLRKKSWCILNKQYTKEEYEKRVPEIIEHMTRMPYRDAQNILYSYGEFFPSELSPFCYNETLAQDYLPLSIEKAGLNGFSWKANDETPPSDVIHWKDLPESVTDVDTDTLSKAILCRSFDEDAPSALMHNCTKAFRPIQQEIEWHKKQGIPIPHRCPNCRHFARLIRRTSMQLWQRTCSCDRENHPWHESTDGQRCTQQFKTAYSPERPELIYCEKCYSALF